MPVSNVRPSVRTYLPVHAYVRLSTKSSFDFSEMWRVGRGPWVMHDGMQYDPIQVQGHEPFRVGNPFISAIYNGSWQLTTDS